MSVPNSIFPAAEEPSQCTAVMESIQCVGKLHAFERAANTAPALIRSRAADVAVFDDTLMVTMLACPVCGGVLTLGAAAATCSNKHAFDRARSGYLNLLLTKQSAEPGDSAPMLQSRRAFLQAGFYDAISSASIAAVVGILAKRTHAHVVDVGCGEGFFTARLNRTLAEAISPAPTCYGIDISRPGVRMATSYDAGIHWVVASLHHTPFLPRSLDVVLCMFAPIDPADARRIVRHDGALVTVTPGSDHLDGLRALLYTNVQPHSPMPALMDGDTRFEPAESTRVHESIVVDSPAQIMNLLAMTPYYWNISRDTRARVEALTRLELTVDACVNVFRPRISANARR
jgi:23S rRNA (guanine745-N1)-methyltransferase